MPALGKAERGRGVSGRGVEGGVGADLRCR